MIASRRFLAVVTIAVGATVGAFAAASAAPMSSMGAYSSSAGQASVATPAQQQYYPDLPTEVIEPMDTMAQAVHQLCSMPPQSLTGKVTRSLTLICELGEPVYALDGRTLLEGWQSADIAPERLIDPDTVTS